MSILCDLGPILRPYIATFWTSESGPASFGHRQIVPDGKPGLVIRYSEGGSGARVFFGGQATKSSIYEMQPNQKFFGAHFHSVGAAEFLGIPLGEATDKSIDLKDWDISWAREMEEQSAAATTDWERSLIVRRLLERKLVSSQPNYTAIALVDKIRKSQGLLNVKELSHSVGTSERQVERIFQNAVGLSPRKLNSIFRFRKALFSMRNSPQTPLTEVALNAGYYDQSHFIREFKAMTGVSPKNYLRGPQALNDWQGIDL